MAVDGKGADNNDTDTTVDISVGNFGNQNDYYVFYSLDNGNWVSLGQPGEGDYTDLPTVEGGALISFAINTTGSDPTEDSSSLFLKNATIIWDEPIDANDSQKPVLTYAYYRAVGIEWNLVGDDSYKLNILGTSSTVDGFKAVPIPGSLLLLGSGVFGLVMLRGRRKAAMNG